MTGWTDDAGRAPAADEIEALRRKGFETLVFGPVGERMDLDESPHVQLRLAHYEQFVAREPRAAARLLAVAGDERTPPAVRRDALAMHRLSVAFGPELSETPIIWGEEQPPAETDAAGIRERIAIAMGRLTDDGRTSASGRMPGGWEAVSALVSQAYEATIERLRDADLARLLDDLDMQFCLLMVLLIVAESPRVVELSDAIGAAHARFGLHALDHLLDYATAIALLVMLDIPAAIARLDQAVDGFAPSDDRRWWMSAKALQALLASVTGGPPPPDLDELERALVSGRWRDGRRSVGQAALVLMAKALSHHGDHEGAKRLALADGGLDDLVLPSPDRIAVVEEIMLVAVAEGDQETAVRMLGIADDMMGSPTVVATRERMHRAFDLARGGERPAHPVSDGSPIEGLRTRWMLLAQTVTSGSRAEAWSALAEFDAFAGRAEMAAMRQRGIGLFRARTSASAASALPQRVLEVATLAASGLTNREIAAQLFLGVRTVEGYVSEALRALDLQRRSDLATAELPLRLREGAAEPVLVPLRQGQVGSLIAAGASNAEIATVLQVTEKTVDKHIAALKDRIGVGTRTAIAAAFAG